VPGSDPPNHLSERDWEVKETAGPVCALSSANV
jgi:hypothetical protein